MMRVLEFKSKTVIVLPTALCYNKKQEERLISFSTTGSKIMLNLNLEVVLDHTKDIHDYQLISEHFQKKWETKYACHKSEIMASVTKPDIITSN